MKTNEYLENADTEEIIFGNVNQLLTMETENKLIQVQYDMPAHKQCAAPTHTFNLVASTDIDKYLLTSPVSRNFIEAHLLNVQLYGIRSVNQLLQLTMLRR